MRRLALAVLVTVVASAATNSPVDQVSAESVLERALNASTALHSTRIGDYTWIEDAGIAIQLPPAPRINGDLPALMAGRRRDEARSAALWEIGPGGFTTLQRKLEAQQAVLSNTRAWLFRPRGYDEEISGQRTNLAFPGNTRGALLDWRSSGRHFALVVTDNSLDAAGRRLEDLVREMVQVPGLEAVGVAPLMLQGRYTCALNGWQRDGVRLRKRTPHGWMGMRYFHVAAAEFESVGRLQFELEIRLDGAGFKRSAGLKPNIGGSEGFIGEYFGDDGFVQRVAYARLDRGYLVVLMQAPEAQRAALADEMNHLATNLRPTSLGVLMGAPPVYFNRVQTVRCLAWQDGRRVLWGVLFDDGRREPVLWREEGIKWHAELTRQGQTLRERVGESNSSRALNPLVDSDLRALELPEGTTGEVELTVEVNGLKTSTRIQLK